MNSGRPSQQRARHDVGAALLAVLVVLAAACSSTPQDDDASATSSTTGDVDVTPASDAPVPSSGCDRSRAVGPGTTDERLASEGVERSYVQIVPDGYDAATPLPVVLGLHALTVDYHVVPSMSGFQEAAEDHEFIGIAPSGRLSEGGTPFWNAAPAEDNYDIAFLTELLDQLEDTLCIDTARVFSVGMSNGAQMSSLLACRLDDRVAAVAPIAGVEFNEPCDGRPVPVIAFHGVEDPIVPYEGGGLSSVQIADMHHYLGDLPDGITAPPGVDESMDLWAEHNGCDAEPVDERVSPEVVVRTWQGCDAPTVLYVVENGGHAWPGRPQPGFEDQFGHATTDIDATDLLFRFFFDRDA